MGRPKRNLTGVKFENFTVVKLSIGDLWECECVCGKEFLVKGRYLHINGTQSCGCLRLKYNTPVSQIPEHRAWIKAKQRCLDKNNNRYKNYGERGITMCDEWLNSFDAFISYMGPKPTVKHTIDRINVNKGYEPGNCKWSTVAEQAANKTNSVILNTPEGKMTFKEASEKFGLSISTIKSRIGYGFSKNEIFLQDDLRKMAVRNINNDTGTKVRDTLTGKTYTTIKKAALDLGGSHKRLAHMLAGNTKNDTSIVKI